ncbi:ribosomal RNA-processing protein 8 [Ixodes scapularis]|uniref:ribosomal RNA-processing protein 8 n=1 Tax=Ixodes scapularis TaxID=6945 RepID=UPI001A9D1319|nr:ribosomal RNA-processing protein 8 [Ixodes scapularis]
MKPKLIHPKHPKHVRVTSTSEVLACKIGAKKRSHLKQTSLSSTKQTAFVPFEADSVPFSHSPISKKSVGPVEQLFPSPKRKKGDYEVAVKAKRQKYLNTDRDTETSVKPTRERRSKLQKPKLKSRAEAEDESASEARLLDELRSGVTSILSGLDPDENFQRPRPLRPEAKTKHLAPAPQDSPSKEGEDERKKKRRKKKRKSATNSADLGTRTKASTSKASLDKLEAGYSSNEPGISRKVSSAKNQMTASKAPQPTRFDKQGKSARSGVPTNLDPQITKEECLKEQPTLTKCKKRKRHRKLTAHAPTSELDGSKPLACDKRAKGDYGTAKSHRQELSDDEATAEADVAEGDDDSEPNVAPLQGSKKAKSKWSLSSGPASSQDVRERALERLRAARFRLLNEELYTSQSADAVRSFEEDPKAFQVYHEGFERQVSKWPVNPVDVIIDSLRSMPNTTVIADLGCGEAKIARTLTKKKVHSFDLKALNDQVTVCDMSRLPLYRQTVDVAVFCLSLMGTNLNAFILEANRILKKGGLLKIAEVKSRFRNIDGFPKAMKKFGFQFVQKDDSNKMFVLFDFKKLRSTSKHPYLPQLKLMPCLYKKR